MWSAIIGQVKVKDKLSSLYKAGKPSHAYLFYGNEGVGKDAAAIELAKLVNCTDVQNGDEACGKCDSCRHINEFRSEYFTFICALPAGKSEETDSDPIEKLTAGDFDLYMEQLKIKSSNPYHQVSIPNANNIRINSIRSLVSKIYLSAPANHTKVFLISEAEKMRAEAANSLLKVLEEPPAKSMIILTTSKINALPQTIAGRCQQIHFEPLSAIQVTSKLKQTTSYSEKDIALAASIAGGSYSRALQLLDYGINEIRNSALDYLISILKNEFADTVLVARNITSKNDRVKTKYFLYFLNTWFRDLLHVRFATDTNPANSDIMERLQKLHLNYPESDIYNIIMEIEEADRLVTQNIQLALILINLAFKLKEYIH